VKKLSMLLLCLVAFAARAQQNLLMVRTQLEAPEAMAVLKETVQEYGYTVAHVQRCDGGMSQFHYKTDYYRVLFFGKLAEARGILKHYPQMAPFIPLKIAVIAEKNETVLAAVDPRSLGRLYGHDPVLRVQFARWYNDLKSILEELRTFKPKS